ECQGPSWHSTGASASRATPRYGVGDTVGSGSGGGGGATKSALPASGTSSIQVLPGASLTTVPESSTSRISSVADPFDQVAWTVCPPLEIQASPLPSSSVLGMLWLTVTGTRSTMTLTAVSDDPFVSTSGAPACDRSQS